MLKIITLITKFILVALTALLFGSCNESNTLKSLKGSGNVTTERRTVEGDFKRIEVSNAIDLIIEQSDVTEIVVEADDNLQKHIVTKIKDGTLIISCDKYSFFNMKSKKVLVKMPIIELLEANSSATITGVNTIKGEDITLHTSSAGTITLNIESDEITGDSSSGSSIVIDGIALKIKADASSGSEIDAAKVLANEVTAEASSGASIKVHPIVSLKAEASSGGSISYNKAPKSIRKEISSGGSIQQE